MQTQAHALVDAGVPAAMPVLDARCGQVTATSLQVAEHFGKRHADVLRAIKKLEIPDEDRERNFALTINRVAGPKGALRDEPLFHITRDGFALLAMGFTGKEAMRWKLAYIKAFNMMEARIRALYVEPLVSEKEFRRGISLRDKLILQEQSRQIAIKLQAEAAPVIRRNLYWQLRQVNDALGIPTESAEQLLGADANFPVLETEF